MHAWMRTRAGGALGVAASTCLAGAAIAADATVEDLVHETAKIVRERYIEPEAAERAAKLLETRMADGVYDGMNPPVVAKLITQDLRAATGDRHFRLSHDPMKFAYLQTEGDLHSPTPPEERRRRAKATNYGFTEARILSGNVGYLKLDSFDWEPGAAEKAAAVMALLGDADAIILDLRDNGGGWATMERLMCSYFLEPDDDVPLLVFETRYTGETKQVWINDWLPEERILEPPVFVLTSGFEVVEGGMTARVELADGRKMRFKQTPPER